MRIEPIRLFTYVSLNNRFAISYRHCDLSEIIIIKIRELKIVWRQTNGSRRLLRLD